MRGEGFTILHVGGGERGKGVDANLKFSIILVVAYPHSPLFTRRRNARYMSRGGELAKPVCCDLQCAASLERKYLLHRTYDYHNFSPKVDHSKTINCPERNVQGEKWGKERRECNYAGNLSAKSHIAASQS